MRALFAVVLFPLIAQAAPAKLLILGGGAKPEDAAKAIEQWGKVAPEMLIDPADGFPKAIESATVKGLKPGFHVAVIGGCDEGEGLRALEATRQLYPGSYFRPVEWDGALPCPTLSKGWKVAPGASTTSAKEGSLSSWAFKRDLPGNTEVKAWVVEARGPDQALIELVGADLAKADTVGVPDRADMSSDLREATAKGDELTLSYSIYQRGCTTPAVQIVEQRLKLKGGKVQTQWKLGKYKAGECD